MELAKLTIHVYEFNLRGRLGAVTQKLSKGGRTKYPKIIPTKFQLNPFSGFCCGKFSQHFSLPSVVFLVLNKKQASKTINKIDMFCDYFISYISE